MRHDKIECVRILLSVGVDINQIDGTGRSALHLATWSGYDDIVTELIQMNPQIDMKDESGDTPLHIACWFGYLMIAKKLIDKGADVNSQDNTGKTPLHFACQHNHIEIVDCLLSHHANPKLKNSDGLTPEKLSEQNQSIIDLIHQYTDNDQRTNSQAERDKLNMQVVFEELERLKHVTNMLNEQIALLKGTIKTHQRQISSLVNENDKLKDQVKKLQESVTRIDSPVMSQSRFKFTEFPKCDECKVMPGALKCPTCNAILCESCASKYGNRCPKCNN